MWKRLIQYHKRYQMLGYWDRTMLMLLGSVVINGLIGVGKLIHGIFIFSPWFKATAIYYLLLCGARGQLLWRFKQTRLIEEPSERFEKQFAVFRHSGIFICLIGLSYFFVCLRMYLWSEGNTYPFYLMYGAAEVAFYKIGTSIYGGIRTGSDTERRSVWSGMRPCIYGHRRLHASSEKSVSQYRSVQYCRGRRPKVSVTL